jgi:hypothetical protein
MTRGFSMSDSLFDEWYAEHQESCGNTGLDVSVECLVEGESEIHVRCPICGESLSGSAAADLLDIAARLAPGQYVRVG